MAGDDRVFYSHFDGTTWAPQQFVPGIGTNPVDIHLAAAMPGLAVLPGDAAAT